MRRRSSFPLELNSEVRRLSCEGDHFVLAVDERTIAADQVVVATGPVPDALRPQRCGEPGRLADAQHGLPPAERRPGRNGPGRRRWQHRVSAREGALGHAQVVLSVGSKQTPLPQRIAGRDLFWWLTRTHLLSITVESRLGGKLQHRDTLIGSSPRELRRRYGVEVKPRVIDGSGRTVRFEDGSDLEVDAVVWATGYRPDFSWIDLPIIENGRLRHQRGVTDIPGLYCLGLTWQWTRGSALMGWVKNDAEFIAERIAALQEPRRTRPSQTTGSGSAVGNSPSTELPSRLT